MQQLSLHEINSRSDRQPIIATLAVTLRDGRVLLIRRNSEADAARWGLPGGEVRWGETILDAAQREVSEEAGLSTRPIQAFSSHEIIETDATGRTDRHIIFIAVLCVGLPGQPDIGDDAREARWFQLEDLANASIKLNKNVVEIVQRASQLHRGLCSVSNNAF